GRNSCGAGNDRPESYLSQTPGLREFFLPKKSLRGFKSPTGANSPRTSPILPSAAAALCTSLSLSARPSTSGSKLEQTLGRFTRPDPYAGTCKLTNPEA